MKKFIKLHKILWLFVLAPFFCGCGDDDGPTTKKAVAAFVHSINEKTGMVTFLNLSENADDFNWDFGDGTSSTLLNPEKTYATGTYTVVLTASNSSGTSTFEDEIVINIPLPINFPVTFDDPNVDYDVSTFGGTGFDIVDNPDQSGTNMAATKVGAVTNNGVAFEGITFPIGVPLDLSELKSVKINFWSDKAIDVLLKLEDGTAANIETSASHGGSGWEEIYFTFDSSASYSRIVIFVDGPGTTSGTFYFDDIMQLATDAIPCPQTDLELPIDFDCNGIDYIAKIVGNVSFEVVDNPELSGINAEESKVGKIVNVGENWENAFFNLDIAIDFSTNNAVKFKLFSNQALPIKLKFEDGTEDPVESDVDHTGSGWEELTFNFTSTASYNDMIVFVDGPGTASGTFYIDDIEQVTGVSCDAETMQSISPSDFNLTFMNDPETTATQGGESNKFYQDNVTYEYVDNPDFSGPTNTSCKVGKVTKSNVQPWDNLQIDFNEKFTFADGDNFTIKVFSPVSGYKVTLKLEDKTTSGATTSGDRESTASTTKINEWEELTIPFGTADSGKYDRLVIFFDLTTASTNTYYFDDLKLNRGSGGGGGGGTGGDNLLTNGDFENGTAGWSGNAANVVTEGGNSYNFADVMTAGDAFAVNVSQVLEIKPGKSYTLKFDASSDRNRGIIAGIGLNEAPWSSATETVNLTTTTQTFTLNLVAKDDTSGADFGIPNSRVLFDMGAAVGTVVIDNVSLVCNDCDSGTGGGGGSGSGGGSGDNLASNGDFETGTDSGWIRFQNGGTAVLDNSISNGGTWSGKIATGGASNPAFKQEAIGAGTVAAGDKVTISFDHIGSVAGEGGVFNVLLFGEGAAGASFTHVFNPAPILSGSWITFTGSYTIPAGIDVSGGISFLIETVCGGAAGCSVSANIDNVSVTLN